MEEKVKSQNTNGLISTIKPTAYKYQYSQYKVFCMYPIMRS